MNTFFKLLLTISISLSLTPSILCMDTLESFFQQLGFPDLIQQVAQKPGESPVKKLIEESYSPSSSTYIQCALPHLPTPFEPHKQPNDPDLIKKRILCHNGKFTDTFSHCELVPKKRRSGICFTRAIEHALDLAPDKFNELRPAILGDEDLFTVLKILKFFEQKEKAEPNACVFYVSSTKPDLIIHAAWVKRIEKDGKIIIQSKFGPDNEYITGLFELPDFYGDTAFFCTLKKQFTDQSGKDYIFSKLQQRIAGSKILQVKLEYVSQLLFRIVNTITPNLENTTLEKYMATAIKETCEARDHLERYPIIDINAQDAHGNTVLMLAAAHGKHSLIKTFLKYGAHPDLKNKKGFTAVDMANNNKHTNIANFILNYSK